MAIAYSSILTRATDLLLDAGNVRWLSEELMRWVSDGRREACVLRPDLFAVVSTVVLVSGTKQSVPSDGTRFIDALRNINADDTPGRSVRVVEREMLDAQQLGWHSAKSGVTKNFAFDERVPKVFHVSPPASAGAKLEIAYARMPAEVSNPDDLMTEDELIVPALVDYLLFRAFGKDAEFAGNEARSLAAYQRFLNALGFGLKASILTSPNTANQGGTPARVAV